MLIDFSLSCQTNFPEIKIIHAGINLVLFVTPGVSDDLCDREFVIFRKNFFMKK